MNLHKENRNARRNGGNLHDHASCSEPPSPARQEREYTVGGKIVIYNYPVYIRVLIDTGHLFRGNLIAKTLHDKIREGVNRRSALSETTVEMSNLPKSKVECVWSSEQHDCLTPCNKPSLCKTNSLFETNYDKYGYGYDHTARTVYSSAMSNTTCQQTEGRYKFDVDLRDEGTGDARPYSVTLKGLVSHVLDIGYDMIICRTDIDKYGLLDQLPIHFRRGGEDVKILPSDDSANRADAEVAAHQASAWDHAQFMLNAIYSKEEFDWTPLGMT